MCSGFSASGLGFSLETTAFWGLSAWELGVLCLGEGGEGFMEGLRVGLKSGKFSSARDCGCSILQIRYREGKRKRGIASG